MLLSCTSALATEYTFTGLSGSNDWSSGTDWSQIPVSASDTILTYSGSLADGATLTSNNDVSDPFQLNRLNFSYDGPGTGTAPVITFTGGALNFVADGSTSPVFSIRPGGSVQPNLTVNNNVILSDDINISTDTNVTFNGQISGAFNINLTGSAGDNAIITLTNTSNNWSGNTRIYTNGTVGGTRALTLGASNVIPDGASAGNIQIESNGEASHSSVFRLNGFNETVNGVEGYYEPNMRNKDFNQVIENGGNTNSTLTIGANNTTANFMGRVRDKANTSSATGTLSVTKIGSGNQTFAGVATHTGSTTINEGTLTVDFTQIGISQTSDAANYFSTTSDLTMGGGTTFAIVGREDGGAVTDNVGTQQYANYITVSSQAIADELTVGQELTIDKDGSITTYFVTGIIGQTIYTETRTGGGAGVLTTSATNATTTQEIQSLTIAGAFGETSTLDFGSSDNVTLLFGSAPTQLNDGSTITISNWNLGGDHLTFSGEPGEFTSIWDQSEIIFDGFGSGYNIIDGDGIYELTAVPEPSTYALLAASGVLLFAIRRRKR